MSTLPITSDPQLTAAITPLRRRYLILGIPAALIWSLLIAVAALVLFAWADLAVELSPITRALCTAAAIGLAAAILCRLILLLLQARHPHRLARQIDHSASAHGQVLAGIELVENMNSGSNLSAGLSMLAVHRAAEIINQTNIDAVMPAQTLRRPAILIAITTIALIIFSALFPRLTSTQWQRFADPFGDHPPYSRFTFDVQPQNATVIYGGALDISATVHGGIADSLQLQTINNSPDNQPIPMFPQGQDKWRATLVNVTAPTKYVISFGRARTTQFQINVITVPKLVDAQFKIQLPAYTHRPAYQGPMPQNGIAGLAGTTVNVTAKSNRPLSAGKLTLTPADGSPNISILMSPLPTDATQVIGQFQIHSPARLTLSVTDIAGQNSTDTLTTSITLLKDQRPIVRMISPPGNSFATPDASLTAEALAEDDYGLSNVQIFRNLNQSQPLAVDLPLPPGNPTQFPARLDMHLADYGLKPGDVIQLFARAQDNDPAGAKGSESPVVTVHIISQKEMDKLLLTRQGLEALQSKYAAAERRMEAIQLQLTKLQKELENQKPKDPAAAETQKKIDDLSQQMQQAADDINKLADHQLPVDLDQALNQHLAELSNALQQAANQAKTSSAKSGLSVAGALKDLAAIQQALGQQQQNFDQKTTAPLDHLAKIYPLLEDQARYLDLHDRQKDLADRLTTLQSLNGNDDPAAKARMRDLEDEQQHIRDDLRELLDDINNHVAALPDDQRLDDLRTTAKQFAEAVRTSPAAGQMQGAESALDEFTGPPAAASASAAEQTLEKFITKCNSMGSGASACLRFQPELANGLGDSVNQLLSAAGLSGGGAGYSATHNSLQNVGLYGTLPTHGTESRGQSGGSAERGIATNSNGNPSDSANPQGAAQLNQQTAAGQSNAPVPPQYKQRVGDYFRRVADELSN